MKWEVVIGLETHAQLSTQSKIFSGASVAFGAGPNTQACGVDIALPGVLPVLNKGAVERAIRLGLAVGGNIARRSVFARKNYFYPDLPKGYQISQYELPIVSGGAIKINVDGVERTIRLTRAHLEEDAGKSLHEDFHGLSGIDLNRAGTPLLEIVSEPDMRSAKEAVAYSKALHTLVRWIGICDGNMQEGSFRCDANVSVRRPGEPLGTRAEIKNLNSFRFMERAIEFEVARQIEIIEDGGKVVQETRLYDADKDETRSMRSKEDAHDYRYFPDPDLLPLEVTEAWIDAVRAETPELLELPDAKRSRYIKTYGIPSYLADRLVGTFETAIYFESTVEEVTKSLKQGVSNSQVERLGNIIVTLIASRLLREGITIAQAPVKAFRFARLMLREFDGTLSTSMTGDVLMNTMWTGEGSADEFIDKLGLKQMSDTDAIEKIIDDILAANPAQVAEYRAGKEKAFNFFVGQVMKKSGGTANPAQVNEILKRKLAC